MQRVRVAFGGNAHGSEPAVEQETAVILQVSTRGVGLVEHRFHRQLSPVKMSRPHLLSLEWEQHQLAAFVLKSQRAYSAGVAKGGGLQRAMFDQ